MARVRRTQFATVGGLTALLLLAGGAPAVAATAGGTVDRAALASGDALAGVSAAKKAIPCDPVTKFDAYNFPRSPRITNRFLPLLPGTQFTLEGRANRGGGPLPHTVVLTVTDLTKVIQGVRTVVLYDVDSNEGQLQEAELAFHAQDAVGRVWGLGEYPEEYENGKFTGAPNTWISGQAGAQGGIMMLANPQLGTPRYLQGSAPAIDFLDCAQVFQTGQHVCVEGTCYDNVLVTDENSPLDPASGHQRKFFAPGVGNIKVTAVDDPEGETLVLTKVSYLSPQSLDKARKAALKLEKRAYQVSAVYRTTPPMS
jgi:hypothetical protein